MNQTSELRTKMFDKPELIFSIDQKESFDTCPACQKKIDKAEINVSAQFVYVKLDAPTENPRAQLLGIKITQIIHCLAHDVCIEEFTIPESKGIYNLKPEKYQEVLTRGN